MGQAWMFMVAGLMVVGLIFGGVIFFVLSRRNKEPALAGGGTWPGSTGPAATPPQNVGGATPIGGPAPSGRGAGGGGAAAPPPPPPPSRRRRDQLQKLRFRPPPGAQYCPRCGKPQS